MKKYLPLLLAAVLMTGCQSTSTSSGAASEATSSQAATSDAAKTAEATAQATGEAQSTAVFKAGTWRGASSYYFFYAEGGGTTLSYNVGIGMGFNYDVDGSEIVFHIGSAEDNTPGTLSDITEDSVTISWDSGTTETLVYVSELNADEFTFYIDSQISTAATGYYAAAAQIDADAVTASLEYNDDGTVTVSVTGGASDAQYIVERITLAATDASTGESIDLTAYAE